MQSKLFSSNLFYDKKIIYYKIGIAVYLSHFMNIDMNNSQFSILF